MVPLELDTQGVPSPASAYAPTPTPTQFFYCFT